MRADQEHSNQMILIFEVIMVLFYQVRQYGRPPNSSLSRTWNEDIFVAVFCPLLGTWFRSNNGNRRTARHLIKPNLMIEFRQSWKHEVHLCPLNISENCKLASVFQAPDSFCRELLRVAETV